MPHGGARPGSGRKKGSATAKTRELADKAAAEGLTPLAFMLWTLGNEEMPFEQRFTAAEKAAPYCHPRLQAVTVAGDPEKPLQFQDISDLDRAKALAALVSKVK